MLSGYHIGGGNAIDIIENLQWTSYNSSSGRP